ncbi:MAG: rhodanese-like domain-containing protein [Nitrospiraceae bacterium]|nr:MAG: rhodanese-like domain-containing protein [Nitrospiraceae bacterium]
MKVDIKTTCRVKTTFWQGVVIFLISAALGLLVNTFRDEGILVVADWSQDVRPTVVSGKSMVISLGEAERLCMNKQAISIDARSPELYAQGHIRYALNLPFQEFDKYIDRVRDKIPYDAWIVVYCDGEQCSLSEDLAKQLVSMGYKKVKILLNGWTRWLEAGLPIDSGLQNE